MTGAERLLALVATLEDADPATVLKVSLADLRDLVHTEVAEPVSTAELARRAALHDDLAHPRQLQELDPRTALDMVAGRHLTDEEAAEHYNRTRLAQAEAAKATPMIALISERPEFQ